MTLESTYKIGKHSGANEHDRGLITNRATTATAKRGGSMVETTRICVDATRGCYAPDLRRIAWLPSILGFGCCLLAFYCLRKDVPRSKLHDSILDWIERRHPNWLVPRSEQR